VWLFPLKNLSMFKLLTETASGLIEKEYKSRRLVVMFFGLSVVFLIGSISLIPAFVLGRARLHEANLRNESLKLLPSSQDGFALEKWLADVNQKVSLFSKGTDQNKPYELFMKIIEVKPSGISLKKLGWLVDVEKLNIVVGGTAKDRQALLSFEAALNDTKKFSKAAVPVSNFARDKDIDFEFTVSPVKGALH